jgi:hypothetical protein
LNRAIPLARFAGSRAHAHCDHEQHQAGDAEDERDLGAPLA